MPICPGASSVSSNSASASPSSERPRSTSPARAARTPEVAQRHADTSAVAELAAQRQRLLQPLAAELVLPSRAGEVAEAVQRERRAHRVVAPRGSGPGSRPGARAPARSAPGRGRRRRARPGRSRPRAWRPRGERTARSPRSTSAAPRPVPPPRRTGRPCGPERTGRRRRREARATGSGFPAAPRGRPRSPRDTGRARPRSAGPPPSTLPSSSSSASARLWA